MPAAGDPVNISDYNTFSDYTVARPLVRLVQQSSQSLAHNTTVAVTYGSASEEIDTHGYHDEVTNNTRITPLIAGYYRAYVTLSVASSNSNTIGTIDTWVAKNGTTIIPIGRRVEPQILGIRTIYSTAIVSLNGSTDYVEHIGRQTQTSPNTLAGATQVGGGNASAFELEFLRPL